MWTGSGGATSVDCATALTALTACFAGIGAAAAVPARRTPAAARIVLICMVGRLLNVG